MKKTEGLLALFRFPVFSSSSRSLFFLGQRPRPRSRNNKKTLHFISEKPQLIIIQVLDDSTDKTTRDLVDDKVAEWRERGVNCYALRRTNRSGYKAGALKEGLEELADYDYIAIFDADFKPEPDFLTATVPYLIDNPEVREEFRVFEFFLSCSASLLLLLFLSYLPLSLLL